MVSKGHPVLAVSHWIGKEHGGLFTCGRFYKFVLVAPHRTSVGIAGPC